MALKFLIENYFRIRDVFAIRLAKSIQSLRPCPHATSSVIIYYQPSDTPDFKIYELNETAECVEVDYHTGGNKTRIIQCLIKQGCQKDVHDNIEMAEEMMPNPATSQSNTEAEGALGNDEP